MPDHSPSKPVVYACSGCSDAGELADRIARRIAREGLAEMSCLAGVGGRINCARRTLELAGVTQVEHLELHELGLRKGACPVTEDNITLGVEAAGKKIAGISSD